MTTLAKTRPTTRRALFLTLAVAMLVTLVSPTATHAVEVDPPAATDSILVVAPHPGGAAIIAGGITAPLSSFAAGAGVTIAYVTNGDAVDEATGTTRQGEAVAGQALLGRAEADLIFMGYPDAFLDAVWATDAPTVWAHPTTARTSTYATRGLGGTDWYDYRMGEPADEHADYNKDAMLADMEALIAARQPDHIFTASEWNNNDDYTTTNALVTQALANVVLADPTYGAVVHTAVVWHPDMVLWNTWPQNRDSSADIVSDVSLGASPSIETFSAGAAAWAAREQFVIPTAWQSDTDGNPKSLAIAAQATIGGLGGFIGRFVHRDEIFWAESVNMPELSISDASVTEGGNMVFTVSRSGALNMPVSVTATTSGGTATAGVDFTTTTAPVSLAAGAASATFTVPTTTDDVDELNETFIVTLSAPAGGATLAADPTGTGTITDDDTAGVTVDEGDGLLVVEGGALDTYSIVLDSEPTDNVVVTATPDAQVTAAPSPLTFTPANWDTPQTVSVTGISDGVDEPDPHTGTITHTVASDDLGYDGVAAASATADVNDATGLTVEVTGLKAASTGVAAEYSAAVTAGGNGTVTFAWTLTRGTTTVDTGTGATFSFTPTAGGIHTVTMIPSDNSGAHAPVVVTVNVLTDIETNTFVNDIIWLADAGITAGCNPPANDQFCPEKNVTRGQMAAFLVRFLGLTDDGGGNTFTDDDGSIFEDDIAKLAAAGITTGCNAAGTEFCPGKNVTRGQMAAFLKRASALSS
jgi:LmbE family N-acetylglucosaminyl deacetylase